MAEAMDAMKSTFADADITVTAGSSGLICKQIENGAPADIVITADRSFIAGLDKKSLVIPDSIRSFASNQLVIVSRERPGAAQPMSNLSSLQDSQFKRIAIGNPEHVPAGIFAMQSLKHAELDQKLKDKLVFADDVRMATRYAAQGAADAAIVYRSDTLAFEDEVKIIFEIPPDFHAPIEYVAAICKSSKQPDVAKKFLQFILEPNQQAALKKLGFESTPPTGSKP